jgi:hypothetical protein
VVPRLEAIRDEVRVREAPAQRPRLGDRDEAREVEHLALEVAAVLEAGEVEELRAVRDLGLKPARTMPDDPLNA